MVLSSELLSSELLSSELLESYLESPVYAPILKCVLLDDSEFGVLHSFFSIYKVIFVQGEVRYLVSVCKVRVSSFPSTICQRGYLFCSVENQTAAA